MNTNIKITLTEDQRDHIKNVIEGKTNSKLASRQDVNNLVEMFVKELLESEATEAKEIVQETIQKVSGYKFYSDGQEITYEKWIDIPCDDCGCLVSVSKEVYDKSIIKGE
jgi:hypothetical protein|tara:strand:- start:358 stop:687 length:330 start_codon:yes stop_codon:yes gene_type:complete